MANLLVNLWWISYAISVIAAMIAWQFGRSRLVYACLLLFTVAANKELTLSPELLEVTYSGTLFGFVFLLYSKDKGFSALNLCFSLVVLLVLFVLSWLSIPSLQFASHTWLTSIDSQLFRLFPDICSFVTPFNSLLLIVGLMLGMIRLWLKIDNTHNALYFALALSAFMHTYSNVNFGLNTIVSFAGLFCYSVLKDRFTMVFKDELTGITSRRTLMQYVQTLGRKYTVVMYDIDHFKKVNDTYSHHVGDEVLKLVASKLDKVTEGGKKLRFHGEKFIIILHRKISKEVMPFVELVRKTIADYNITVGANPRPPKPQNIYQINFQLKKYLKKK